jgi:predicted dehydrogenase
MDDGITRRDFLKQGATAGLALGLSAVGPFSGRVLGANGRIRVGIVGPGGRGSDLMREFIPLSKQMNMELVASCDLWDRRREQAAAVIEKATGNPVIRCRNLEEICERKDIDALIIATADFQHAKHLAYAVRAGKDVYVEKPLANDLAHAKECLQAVQQTKRIVQIGTQRRSEGSWPAAAEFLASGALGKVSYIEQAWNYFGARWRLGDVDSQIKEADTDWKRWLLDKPYRPWDAHVYREFRLYWPFSSGIPCQWLSHTIDAIQWVMADPYPHSVVAHGGVYVWRDGRENADTFQALFEYPKGCMVSYSTRFGNDNNSNGPIIYGTNGTLDLPSLTVTGDGGGGAVSVEPGTGKVHRCLVDESTKIKDKLVLEEHPSTSHMRNWMECLRSRQTPNAPVEGGYSHSIAVIMAIEALQSGRRVYFDPKTQTISTTPPAVA